MTERFCPECLDRWPGTYNLDGRCTQCMTPTKFRPGDVPLPLVRFLRVGNHDQRVPRLASDGAAAFDMCATQDATLWPGDEFMMPLGWAVAPPTGHAALLLPRSGKGAAKGLVLGNLVGLIDPDYRGELKASLWYRRQEGERIAIARGHRIAQLFIVPYAAARAVEVESLTMTGRGDGGFGSTDDN